MFAQYDGPKPEKIESDIEGGLGWGGTPGSSPVKAVGTRDLWREAAD